MKRIYLFNRVPFDVIDRTKLIARIISMAENRQKSLVLNMNVYGVVTYLKNTKYARIIDVADIIYPDGWGPVYASRLFSLNLPERVNVGDFIHPLLASVEKKRFRIFLLGSRKEEIINTVKSVNHTYKNITICGYRDGFFTKKQSKDVVSSIRRSRPNIVFVGMGLPIQEYFIRDNWHKLPNAVYMGVGGVFHYISATKKRAPLWMRNSGLEWLYRLFQEPKRLGKRYTITNVEFVYYLLQALVKYYVNKLKITFFN